MECMGVIARHHPYSLFVSGVRRARILLLMFIIGYMGDSIHSPP